MDSPGSTARAPGRRPLPSEPLLGTAPTPWNGPLTPWEGTFPFRAGGNVGPMAWVEIAQKADVAVKAGGFDLAFRQPPRFKPDPWGTTSLRPGIGYLTGEAELVRLPHNAWLTAASYSSVVVSVTLVADPSPTNHDLGAPDRAAIWNVTVALGSVQSYDAADHHVGARRMTKLLPTDPEFGWIPAAIVSSIQS